MNTYSKYAPNVFLAKCPQKHEKGETIVLTTKYGKENEVTVWNLIQEENGYYFYSFTRNDGFTSQERAKRKAEQCEARAAKAAKQALEEAAKSSRIISNIVPGQPILVDHYSARRHRRDLERSDTAMRRAVTLSGKSEELTYKAKKWQKQQNVVDLSMPESLEYFKEKLEQAVEYHEGLKSGKYPRQHSFDVSYANKAVKELRNKVRMANLLWG